MSRFRKLTEIHRPTDIMPKSGPGSPMQPKSGQSDWQYAINSGPISGHIPTGDEYKKLQDQRAAEHNAADAARRQSAADANNALYQSIQDDPEIVKEWQDRVAKGLPGLTPDEITTLRSQHAETARRGALAGGVNAYFDDPGLAGREGQAANALRTNSLGDLALQYQDARTQSAQGAARQGLLGGSVDIENRGALDRANQASAANVETGVQGLYRQSRLRDEAMRTSLLAQIYSPNQGTTQGADANIQSLLAQTQGAGQLGSEASTQMDINHFGNILQSQAYGQALSGLGGAANSYAYNSSGGGW